MQKTCESERGFLKQSEATIRNLMASEIFGEPEAFPGQHGEIKANIVLAVRHIEDARMRLGKVLQYLGNSVSKFDKPDTSA